MQERCNSSALAMELRLSCTNPLIYWTICSTSFEDFTYPFHDLIVMSDRRTLDNRWFQGLQTIHAMIWWLDAKCGDVYLYIAAKYWESLWNFMFLPSGVLWWNNVQKYVKISEEYELACSKIGVILNCKWKFSLVKLSPDHVHKAKSYHSCDTGSYHSSCD